MLSGARPRLVAAALLAAALVRHDAALGSRHQGLDGPGRLMLDPLRDEGLRPQALIARLGLPADAVVADIGAGPGFLTIPLARALPAGRVIATDLRPDYLAVLSQRASAAGLRNVTTRVAAPDRPGLDPAAVDEALLCQVDHHLPDRAAYLGALRPALRPGGRVAVLNYRRHRDAVLAAARAAAFDVLDEWAPSPAFFLLVLTPERGVR